MDGGVSLSPVFSFVEDKMHICYRAHRTCYFKFQNQYVELQFFKMNELLHSPARHVPRVYRMILCPLNLNEGRSRNRYVYLQKTCSLNVYLWQKLWLVIESQSTPQVSRKSESPHHFLYSSFPGFGLINHEMIFFFSVLGHQPSLLYMLSNELNHSSLICILR